ncbi:hypothetical protein V3851_06080 [Paenibacillus sp. M1]|uniref:RiboL-PSP-HEPN domain-containing protein n=1 Tax=Paenibacillus haidiansis TaxID=1574488 RepID=A0ABU7VNT0_9BACL
MKKRLATYHNKQINVIRGLKDDEYTLLNEHIVRIREFEMNYRRINYIAQALKDLNVLMSDRLNKSIKPSDFDTKLYINIISFLTLFRTFLDHWETYIKRTYGNKSLEVTKFKDSTSLEYDRSFSYRFIYELRNFSIHCDIPLDNVNMKLNEETEEKTINIFANRDQLLTVYDWKLVIKRDLLVGPPNIDLYEHFESVIESVINIQRVAINLCDTRKLLEAAMGILKIKEENSMASDFIIIEYTGLNKDSKPENINIEHIPIEFATYVITNILKIK